MGITVDNQIKIKDVLNKLKLGFAIVSNIDSVSPSITSVNDEFLQLTGYDKNELEKQFKGNYYKLIGNYSRIVLTTVFSNEFQDGGVYRCTYCLINKTGQEVWALDNGYFFLDRQGRRCAQLVLTEITDINRSKREVEKGKERLRIGLKSTKTCVFEVDLDVRVFTYFENAEDIFGVSGEEIMTDIKSFTICGDKGYYQSALEYFIYPEDRDIIENAIRDIQAGEVVSFEARMKAGDTQYIWCRIDMTPIWGDGIPVRAIGVITNIDDIKTETYRLRVQASLDVFTGLLNKKWAEWNIKQTIAKKPIGIHALILLDIDNLKAINDSFGHDVGDMVIKTMSNMIQKTFRDEDIKGRFGGDEFIIFMKNVSDRKFIISKANQLLHITGETDVQSSIGIALFPEHGDSFKTLFKNADKALYQSKKKKMTCTIYDPEDS